MVSARRSLRGPDTSGAANESQNHNRFLETSARCSEEVWVEWTSNAVKAASSNDERKDLVTVFEPDSEMSD